LSTLDGVPDSCHRKRLIFPTLAILRLAATLVLPGLCLTACSPRPSRLTFEQRLSVYERANLQLTNAVLFKPAESGPTNTLAFKLAPLLLQEVADTNQVAVSPIVYFQEHKALLGDVVRDLVTFVWRVSDPISRGGDPPPLQGIRITLNASNAPVVWEVLRDDSGGELIFVAKSLETAALESFGQPLGGRRFAIEPSLEAAPNAIVARVIEDGPVPMGPIVHLNAGSENVSTLICRCMPTQSKNLLATQTYQLRPLAQSTLRPGFDRRGEDAGARIARSLRLPAF
jgi:hypothetical protein